MSRADQLASFRSLRTELPRSKFGMIVSLLSEIEELRAMGHRSKTIWECLCADGLVISYDLYRLYLRRARHRTSKSAPTAPGERPRSLTAGADPFAGVRTARGSQVHERFEYDPLTPVKLDDGAPLI